ncbi:pseudouridine synthase [Larkinella insperata]|uniref:Pseudouridine synthase n=1 Tax=Larkinella insperata TaxID=332158 RepID=A0ABW3QDU1_9BACT|nr:pseudouridine synthase [Larkinella insperata]
MSKRREEPTGRREGRTGGAGRPDSASKFYSKFNKDTERRDDSRGEERRERSFDKQRGERSSGAPRRSDDNRSRNDSPRGERSGRYEGGGPRREFDRPRESRDDNRESRRDNDRGFRRDDNRSNRFEGGGPRRDFEGPRSGRPSSDRDNDNRGFRRDERGSADRGNAGRPRFDENRSRNDDRGERSGRYEGGGPRRDFDRPRESRDDNRESRRDNDRGFRRDDDRSNRFGNSEPREDRFGGERSYGDRSRNADARPERRDNRFGNERSYSDRSDRSRDQESRHQRDARPGFDRSRRDDRPSRDDRPGYSDRSRRDENDESYRRKVQDSRERQVGRSQAPDYDIDKLRAKAFAGRDSRDKRGKKPGRSQAVSRSRSESTSEEEDSGLIRLNRYIANSGICSRRDADELIAQGDVSVNGKVITEMGYKVKPTDVVKYGSRVLNPEKMTYVLLNKPKDYITTTDDPNDRNTVMDLVAGATPYRIYPVGRLDRNTTGLLLLTNDGELVEKLTHPSNEVKKVYQVELDKPISEEHFEAIRDGIELEDGYIKPDDLGIVTPDAQVIGIEIHSGRNRIVRRIFEHFGYEVTKLDRTVYAGLTKKELPRGSWRYLDEKEVIRLKFLL